MTAKNKNLGLYFVMGALALLFQNCTGSFQVLNPTNNNNSPTDSSTAKEPGPVTKVLFDANISEMQSVWVNLEGRGPFTFPEGLPKGAVFNQSTRQLSWIPLKGQAGNYHVKVQDDGKDLGIVNVQVAAVSNEVLRAGGPPFRYRDGDIGYIFVHGAGDLDRCAHPEDLPRYWGSGPQTVAPDASNRYVVCYDSRSSVAAAAKGVAEQILAAPCGRFNRCVIFTHSMGGLMMEHMFLHTRDARFTDPEPQMFLQKALYQAVKERTLFVVSLASAAGGSKAASIVNSDGPVLLTQEVVGAASRIIGLNSDSTRNLVVSYASRVVAPYTEDPGVPFFMVPGFTEKTMAEAGIISGLFNITIGSVPLVVFNGDPYLGSLDSVALYQSRSDGLVDFRSGCGVASDRENEGPGRAATLDAHFRYCYSAPKKQNHFVWFMSNMNHYIITGQPFNCRNDTAPCVALFPNDAAGTFSMNTQYTGMNAMQVARSRLVDLSPVPMARVLASASQ